jgi:hypothetical protein
MSSNVSMTASDDGMLFVPSCYNVYFTYIAPVLTFTGSISDKEGQEVEDDEESDGAELST